MRCRSLVALVRVIHPFPVLVVLATSAFLLCVASRGIPSPRLLVQAMVVVSLSQISVGALNDFLDRDSDALTQPQKPIPAGLVSPRLTLGLALTAAIALPPAAALLGGASFALASLGTSAGLAYDLGLKRTPLSFAAYVVAFLALVTWVWVITGRFEPLFAVIYFPGAMLLTCAHLANALPDIETDRLLNQHSLPVMLGAEGSLRAMRLLFLLPAVATALLSLATRSFLALAIVAASAALAWTAFSRDSRSLGTRSSRVLIFRLMAPAIGMLGLAALLTISRIT